MSYENFSKMGHKSLHVFAGISLLKGTSRNFDLNMTSSDENFRVFLISITVVKCVCVLVRALVSVSSSTLSLGQQPQL